MKRLVSGIMLMLLLMVMSSLLFSKFNVKSEPRTIVVPDDYPKIQMAIDYAKEGDEILVKKGVYYENVVVNKAFLKIFGENRESVIQGNVAIIKDNVSFEGFTIIGQNQGIKLDKVNFCTISNCNISNNNIGVSIYHEPSMLSQLYGKNNVIKNILKNNRVGIFSYSYMAIAPQHVCGDYLSNNLFIGNDYGIIVSYKIDSVQPNKVYGGNTIRANTFLQNSHCLYFNYTLSMSMMSDGDAVTFGRNTIHENNFTNNDAVLEVYCESFHISSLTGNIRIIFGNNTIFNNYFRGNKNLRNGSIKYLDVGYMDTWPEGKFIATALEQWDNGYPIGGNFWANYYYEDSYSGSLQNQLGSDGIFDKPYSVDLLNMDKYPLAAPINVFYAGTFNELEYYVDIVSISVISGFHFDPREGTFLKFNVTGENGTRGFSRVTIPKNLLWSDDDWTIFVDNKQITDYTKFEDENYTYLYFTYTHSTKTVTIKGTHVIPEFHSTIILTIFMLTTTVLAVLTRSRRLKHRFNNR